MKRLLYILASLIGLSTTATAASEIKFVTFFVFAKIQDTVLPIERGEKYEDPLDSELKKRKFGEVTGGGTQLKADKSIDWIGVDIELVNLDSALEFTKKKLLELGAPAGSVLEFTKDGKKVVLPIHEQK